MEKTTAIPADFGLGTESPRISRPSFRKKRNSAISLLAVVLLTTLLYFTNLKLNPWNIWQSINVQDIQLSLDSLEDILLSVPDASKVREWSSHYTYESHFVGEGEKLAVWTKQKWEEFGISDTKIVPYTGFATYPVGQRLAMLENNDKVLYEAALIEDTIQDNTTTVRNQAFHGLSVNGNVTGQFVYANFGNPEDFEDLVKANVSLEGKIAIVKLSRGFRGSKIWNAKAHGMIGVITYTDPQQDGEITEGHGYKAYPEGPARPSTYIERGNVLGVVPRSNSSDPDVDILGVPSIPISFADAVPILRALNGLGPKASDMNERWHGGGLSYKGVEYNVGPSPESIVLNLYNGVDNRNTEAYDVIGTIQGSIKDEVVVIGNHRDAWTAGAGDPNSGSAALNEVVRSFGTALKAGWKPKRTIVFASWDGEEVSEIGSSNWVMENLPWLWESTIAYLDVVVAGTGPKFHAKASPLLQKAIHYAAGNVLSPNQTVEGQTVLDVWGGEVAVPGGGDASKFLQFACVPILDMSFSAGPVDAPFLYHSNFDTVGWIEKIGDPNWEYHLTTAKLWSLIAAQLVESPLLPIKTTDYAIALHKYTNVAKDKLPASSKLDFRPLYEAIEKLHQVAVKLDAYAASLSLELPKKREHHCTQSRLAKEIKYVNAKYMKFERQFYYEPGQDSHPENKHSIFARSQWHVDSDAFPELIKSIEAGDWLKAERWQDLLKSQIKNATALLES